MKREYTVACTEHGTMTHDDTARGWVCTPPCCTYLADQDVFHLVVAATPPRRRGPVRVMVSCAPQRAAELAVAGTEMAAAS